MSSEYTIQTTLEKLDRKPALWKGLSIDELLLVVVVSVIGCCLFFMLLFSFFGLTAVGLMLGVLGSMAVVPMLAGFIEKQKKKYGADLLWISLKVKIQKKGWMKFKGVMTEKVVWDTRLSKPRSTLYRGPK